MLVLPYLIALNLAIAIPIVDLQPNSSVETDAVTVEPFTGSCRVTGAQILSRISLSFLNNTCSKLSSDLTVAFQLASVLIDTQLKEVTVNVAKRISYGLLKIEVRYKNILEYVTDLLLCPGRGSELWKKYGQLKHKFSIVWNGLRKAGTNNLYKPPGNVTLGGYYPINITMIHLLEKVRPKSQRTPRSPLIFGLGIGVFGSLIFSKYFYTNNDHELELLNENVRKISHNVKITNERIDLLSVNVSNSINLIKNVLEKLVESNERDDITQTILWNLDNLVTNAANIRNEFKFSQTTITLLDQGILNKELLDVRNIQSIITEGLKSFPELEFPIPVKRHTLTQLVELMSVQRVGHLMYMTTILLTRPEKYSIHTLIPHPINLYSNTVVMPELKNTILTSNKTYIITDSSNIYTLSPQTHVLKSIEPIYNNEKSTCEWEGFRQNKLIMLERCTYRKVGNFNDTFVVETENHRLVYFSSLTRVILECPEGQVRDYMIGLHKLPITCDIITSEMFFPASHFLTVNIEYTQPHDWFDDTKLPLISVNRSDKVHKSLRDLINELPKADDPFTFKFEDYNLPIKRVQSFSIIAQTILTIIVSINSILIAILYFKYLCFAKEDHPTIVQDKFKRVRDSIKKRRTSLRSSLRRKSSDAKDMFKTTLPQKFRNSNSHSNSLTLDNGKIQVNAETNTEIPWESPPYDPTMYPAIPRYNQ